MSERGINRPFKGNSAIFQPEIRLYQENYASPARSRRMPVVGLFLRLHGSRLRPRLRQPRRGV
ncbi:hypothetical protein PC123_g26463, partial [Phytophthora cactorum]